MFLRRLLNLLKLIVLKCSLWKVKGQKIITLSHSQLIKRCCASSKIFDIGLTYRRPSVVHLRMHLNTSLSRVNIYIVLLHFWHRASECRNKSIANLVVFYLSLTINNSAYVSKFKRMASPVFIIVLQYRYVSIRAKAGFIYHNEIFPFEYQVIHFFLAF